MPIVPVYTKQAFLQTPSVRTEAASPVRLERAYENNATRLGRILPAAVSVGLEIAGQESPKKSPGKSVQTSSARPAQDAFAVRAEADEALRLRSDMVASVREEVKQTGAVKSASLESFAQKHFTPQAASGPAGTDYTVLQAAARELERSRQAAALKESVQTEQTLVRRIGALVRSPEALEEYLSVQLPAYRERLSRSGLGKEEVQARIQNVRAQTVRDNVLCALSSGDCWSASAALEKHGSALTEDVKRACAAKTRASFAQRQGEKLWREASLKTTVGPEEIRRIAAASLREPDAELNALIRAELTSLARFAEREEFRAAADELKTLAGLDASSARTFWAGSERLGGKDGELVFRAVQRLDTESFRPEAQTFVTLYFRQSGPENARAFKRGKVTARDFLRLEEARLRGLAGDFSPAEELTVRSADVWMRKKGFSAQDAFLAQYALLTAPNGPAAAWKEIKNYLEV